GGGEGGRGLRADDVCDAVLDGLGVEGIAVVELDAVAQLELHRQVVNSLPFDRELRLDRLQVRAELHQAFVDVAEAALVDRAAVDLRVEAVARWELLGPVGDLYLPIGRCRGAGRRGGCRDPPPAGRAGGGGWGRRRSSRFPAPSDRRSAVPRWAARWPSGPRWMRARCWRRPSRQPG